MKEENKANYNIENYLLANAYCRQGHNIRGGVSIYIKNNLNFKIIEFKTPCIDFIFEYCAVAIPDISLIIICVYRSGSLNTMHSVKQFIDNMDSLLNEIDISQKIAICGDFNIHFESDNQGKKELESILKIHNIHVTIHESTRITENTESTIDNILTNIEETHYEPKNIYTGLSDHSHAQILTITHPQNNKTIKKYSRTFNQKNIDKFTNTITNTDWEDVFEASLVDQKYDIFINKLSSAFSDCFPMKLKSMNTIVKNDWITKGIRNSCETKRMLHKISKNNCDPTFIEYFKNYKKILKKIVSAAKQIPVINKIKKSKNKSKTIWELIDNNPKKNKNKVTDWDKLFQCNASIHDLPGLAEHLNLFFKNSAKFDTALQIANNFCILGPPINESFTATPTTCLTDHSR
uniref:Endonuclease/exonuclease/phosphatase domain-containing protein n=1 Tax=Cacopsylla melanoneura TaxID=428564 RepID=A0A8D8U8H6_9HEMI